MRQHARLRNALLTVLVGGGILVPATGRAHWEGFEAADPTTPAAVLRFDSAIRRYTASDPGPRPWRASQAVRDPDTAGGPAGATTAPHHHAGHAGTALQAPATTER